ncbi:MAG: helical backbone metal receptor, partial [Puniceicoccales bacterium]
GVALQPVRPQHGAEYCKFPPEAQELPHIQGFDSPNPEVLLQLEPDLILASNITRPATASRLRELGLPVFVLPSHGLDGLMDDIERLGDVLHRDEAAADLLTRFDQVRTQLGMRFAGLSMEERPRVFLGYGEQETYTAGPGTFPDQLIKEAGGRNIAYDVKGDWVELSEETLVERDPQVILIPGDISQPTELAGEELMQTYRSDPVWGKLSAVRDGRVYRIDNSLFNIPGPRLTLALQALADTLHPESTPKPVSPESIADKEAQAGVDMAGQTEPAQDSLSGPFPVDRSLAPADVLEGPALAPESTASAAAEMRKQLERPRNKQATDTSSSADAQSDGADVPAADPVEAAAP